VLLAWLLYPHFIGDDTFIHLGFIKDFAAGKGFSFTGVKTYGSTSPLWVILCAAFTKIISSPELAVRILSALFTMTTVYLFYKVLVKNDVDKIIIYAAVASLVLNPFFLRWSLTGMEVTAAMSLLLLIYHLYLQKENSDSKYLGGIAFGLAVLIRPEFLGFLIIFFVYAFFISGGEKKSLFLSITMSITIVLAWLIFSYLYFGTILPNTYIAKAGDSITGFRFENAGRTIKLFAAGNVPEFILFGIIIIAASIVPLKKITEFNFSKYIKASLHQKKLWLPIIWIAGFYIFYILKDVTVISRYSLILVPFIILIAASFLNELQDYLNPKIIRFTIILYSIVIIVVFVFMTFKVVKPASDDFVKGFQTSYMEVASIIKEDSKKHNTSVALTDIGIIGCYSGARVYDFVGLVDKTRFDFKDNREYLIAKKPDYLVLREEYDLDEVVPKNVRTEILFQKKLPGFGINHSNSRTVTLYKLYW